MAAPNDIKKRTSTGLSPYTGTWTKWEVKHLLSRTLFGYTNAQLNSFASKGMAASVDEILTVDTTAPAPPTNDYATGTTDPTCAFGDVWVTAAASGNFNGARRSSLKNWWLKLMLNDATIREKLVFFWQNHFATELDLLNDPRLGYVHLKTLRDGVYSSLKTLVKNITKDPNMLGYLNGQLNTKTAPDENYSRELQELFTVGKDLNPHYTEDDVKAAAKVLTGWRINRTGNPPTSYFDPTRHDTSKKVFSDFYKNAEILGDTSANGGDNELNALVDIIFAHEEVAKYICRKIYRFFVYYDIDITVENEIIVNLANIYRSNNYEIKPVLQTLFKSEHFYDMANRACIIKPPVDYIMSFAKHVNLNLPLNGQTADVLYTHLNIFRGFADSAGQSVFDPPSVAGWPAYYQIPQFHEIWINSNSMPVRIGLFSTYLGNGINRSGYKTVVDILEYTKTFPAPNTASKLITDALELLLPMPPTSNQTAVLKEILLPGGIPDYNWNDEWMQYINDPTNTTKKNLVLNKLKTFWGYIFNLAEYQLQ